MSYTPISDNTVPFSVKNYKNPYAGLYNSNDAYGFEGAEAQANAPIQRSPEDYQPFTQISTELGVQSPDRLMLAGKGPSSNISASPLNAPGVGGFGSPATNRTASNVEKAGNVLGTVSKIAAFLPGVGTAVSAITGAGALIMNWWASSKQMDEQKKARAEAKVAYNAEQAESKRRFDVTNAQNERALANQQKNAMLGFGLASEKQTADIAMDKEKMAMSKDQAQWDKYLGIMQNMSSMMSNPSQRAGYAEQYRRAA